MNEFMNKEERIKYLLGEKIIRQQFLTGTIRPECKQWKRRLNFPNAHSIVTRVFASEELYRKLILELYENDIIKTVFSQAGRDWGKE